MCNAWNHPRGCTCGWGGDGHSGVATGNPYSSQEAWDKRIYRASESPSYGTAESYTDANALCPVCGAEVFFYRSPFNGRVFFDAMGPPWPKHPCTDSSAGGRSTFPNWVLRTKESFGLGTPLWRREGWTPFIVKDASAIPSRPGYFRLKGVLGNQGQEIYVELASFRNGALVQVRKRSDGSYELSLLEVDEAGNVKVTSRIGWDNVTKILTKTSALKNDSRGVGGQGGALADAFRKASEMNKMEHK